MLILPTYIDGHTNINILHRLLPIAIVTNLNVEPKIEITRWEMYKVCVCVCVLREMRERTSCAHLTVYNSH